MQAQLVSEDLEVILRAIQSTDENLIEMSSWLDKAFTEPSSESSIVEHRQANNRLQAEVMTRSAGLAASLNATQKELDQSKRKSAGEEELVKAQERVTLAQELVDKCVP